MIPRGTLAEGLVALLDALRGGHVAVFAFDDDSASMSLSQRARTPPQPAPYHETHGQQHAEDERSEYEDRGQEKQAEQYPYDALDEPHRMMTV